MKNNTRKILLALVVAFAVILSMATVTAFAADGTTVYLDPGEWNSDGARFAIYYWTSDSDNGWVDMTDTGDGVYKGVIPSGYTNCIFVRMNPAFSDNNWENKWNQTGDLTAVADDTFTITDPWLNPSSGTWASGASTGGNTGGGSADIADPNGAKSFTVAGVGGLCGEEWNPAYAANDMTYNASTGLYEKTFTGISAGTYEFKVAADHGWDRSWGDPVNGVGQYGTDFQIILETEQNVTVTFNAKTGEVGCVLSASTGADPSLSDSVEDRTVVLKNSAGWDEVYVYYWSKATGEYSAWPGELMEQGEDGLYSYTIPEGYWGVIFNNGSGGEGNQTINLVVPSADNNYYDNDDLSSNWQRNPNAVQPDNNDDGSEAPKKMTFLQKMAKALLLFLRKIEGFFKNIFVKK